MKSLVLPWIFQIIFDNILNRNIPWPQVPEDMSYEAQDLIDRYFTPPGCSLNLHLIMPVFLQLLNKCF